MKLIEEQIDLSDTYVVDFETYYDDEVSITKQGYTRYICETEAYMVSVVGAELHWVGHPDDFDWRILEGKVLAAHNAAFDMHIIDLKKYMAKPRLDDICTADLCAFLQAPRDLARASKQLLGASVDKGVRSMAKGKRWPQDFDTDARNAMTEYALQDSINARRILVENFHKWPVFERKLSKLTRLMGWGGVPVHMEDLQEARAILQKEYHNLVNKLPWYGEIDPDTRKPYATLSSKALTLHCLQNGIKPPSSRAKDSEEADEWVAKYGEKFPWVQIMQQVNSCNGHLAKVEAMISRTVPHAKGCRMPYGLKYYGADTTGRWAGDTGFNTQNITKGQKFGVDLRNLIRAYEGMKLGIADLSNIEPRCLYFLAGDTKPLDLIRTGIDIYEAHARLTMGYDSDLPLKRPDSDPDAEKFAKFRDLAKVRVLQLGYGSGWHKLYLSARKFNQLHVFDEDYTPEERQQFLDFVTDYNQNLIPVIKKADEKSLRHYINAFRQVMDFRTKSPLITGFWRKAQALLDDAVGDDLEVELPSGRVMRYFNVRRNREGEIVCQTTLGGNFRKFYGAMLVENACQATGRDVFADAMLRFVEETGNIPVLQIHDELANEAPEGMIESLNKTVETYFATTPAWLGDTPLSSESYVTDFYTKK